MKPINLKMSAFGPYKDVEEVDFNVLNEAKLYLITGDTGSGKTTIFDAITFALYGFASGKHREVNGLRSQYALDTTKTFVEFIFENNGVEYKVVRNPEYLRPSLKGDKLTKEKSEATIYYKGKVITGVKNVNSEIESILGITKDQFSQIAMIAQGDFLKLLLADTKERINIFRSLFNTSKYNIFQDKIRELEIEAKNKYIRERDSILQYLNDVITSIENKEKIDDLVVNNNITSIEDIMHLLNIQIKNENNTLHQLEKELQKHDKNITKITTEIGKLEVTSKNIKLVNEAKNFISSNSKLYEDLVLKFNELNAQKEEIESKKGELSILQERFSKHKDVVHEVNDLILEVNKLESSIKNKNTLKAKIIDRNMAIDVDIKELRDIDQIEKLRANKLILSEMLNGINQNRKEVAEFDQLERKLGIEKIKYKNAKNELDDLSRDLEAMENEFYASQAAILAISLEENKPCPVCGSTIHPYIASSTMTLITKEEIDSKKNIIEIKKDELDKIFNDCNSVQINSNNIRNNLNELYGNGFRDEIENKYNVTYSELSLNEQNISQLEKDIKYVSSIKKEKEQNSVNLELLIKEINQIVNDLTAKNTLLEEKNKQLKELSFIDEGVINFLKNTINTYNKQYQEIVVQKDKLSQELEINKSTINNLESQVKETKNIDIGALKVTLNNEKIHRNALEEKIKHSNFVNQRNIDLINKVEINLSTIKTTESRHIMLKSMSDTANGKVSDKEKIMLETYVQMSYFDKVIEYANTRFMIMSEGQFELKRRVERNTRVSQVGLDLDVIDHYNGTTRSVNSLSGGESFMASLSLALGLSDEIQNSSGGINIESMFVDEGFGTLSEDALNNSIKILSNLTVGDKSIGIISHVSDLKQKIDTQVYVSKDRVSGSRIEIRR